MDATELLTQAPGERIVTDSPRRRLVSELRGRRPGRVLVFTGRHSADANGGRRFIEQAALEAGRETVRFSDIEAEPAIGTIEKMTALIRQEKPAAVIALGGGSAMDAAKAAYLSAQSGWPLAEHFGVNRYSERCPDAAADRVICIPTTSGTGSETTPYSNIEIGRAHV